MPEQFQYPEQGWSTGKIRKSNPILDVMESTRKRSDPSEQDKKAKSFDLEKMSDDELQSHLDLFSA